MQTKRFASSVALSLTMVLLQTGALVAQQTRPGATDDALLAPSGPPPATPAPTTPAQPLPSTPRVPIPAPAQLPAVTAPLAAPAQPPPTTAPPIAGPFVPATPADALPPGPPIAPSAGEAGPPSLEAFGPGSGELSPFFNPAVGHAPLRADYRFTWYGAEPVSGQNTNLSYVQHDLGLAFPIWQCGTDEWAVSANLRGEFYHTSAILPNTLQPFPDELWNIRFATSYRHQFDNGWLGGGTFSVGSASDKPFHSIDEMTFGVNAFLRIPWGEHNAWLLSLAYSPTSELPFPIPGVAYLYQPSETFRMNIGLPFVLMWRPTEDLTLDLSYMLLRTVHARASYRLTQWSRAYLSYDWGNEGYFLADRPSYNDRLYYYDMRLTVGVQVLLRKNLSVDVGGGYIFDRFYFEGASFSDNGFNRVDVGAGPFVSVQGRLRW